MSSKACWVVFASNRSVGFPTKREAARYSACLNAFAGREVASAPKKVTP